MLREGDRLVTGHRLVKFLGRGNFGEVWQATAPGNTYAALKFLNLEQSQGRKEYRAIQPLKHLRHAHLLQMTAIYLLDENGEIIPDDAVSDDVLLDTVRGTLTTVTAVPEQHRPCTLIIVMPFADRSLDHLLKEYKQKGAAGIPRDELIDYVEDAAKAIDFLNSPRHDLGQGPVAIRHCDVKPENLLLMGQSVVLCDFGVSRTILGSSTTRKTAMGGSLAYTAPECLSDEVTPYSDQFSLAISYLELRIGKLPFEEDTPASVMDQRRRGILDLSELPKAEAAVIRRATSLQPEKRFPTALDMVIALRAATTGTATSGKGLKVAGLLASLIAVGGTIAFFAIPKPDKQPDVKPEIKHDQPVTQPWANIEQQAFELLNSDSLSDSQWQQAVQLLGQAIDADLPDERLTFPRAESLPNPKLRSDECVAPLLHTFSSLSAEELLIIQRQQPGGIGIARYQQPRQKTGKVLLSNSDMQFTRLLGFGVHLNQAIAVGEQGTTRQILPLEKQSRLPSTLEAVQSTSDFIEVCFSKSGKNSVLLNWSQQKLDSLNGLTTLPLKEIDYTETPEVRLNEAGDWIAIWTQNFLFVARLDGSMNEFIKLALPSTNGDASYAQKPELFCLETDDSRGYVTLRKQDDDLRNSLQLLQFPLNNPKDFEIKDVAGPLDAESACLQRLGDRIAMCAGFKHQQAMAFINIMDLQTFVTSTKLMEEGAEVTACTLQQTPANSNANPKWMAFATMQRRIFLQPLIADLPAIEIAESTGVPRQLFLDDDRLIAGFEDGSVEVYDFRRCRLIITAASEHKKTTRPAKPENMLRS